MIYYIQSSFSSVLKLQVFYNRDKLERGGLQYVSSTEGPMGGRPKRRSPSTIILHLFLPCCDQHIFIITAIKTLTV
jgi:hypothetical protein